MLWNMPWKNPLPPNGTMAHHAGLHVFYAGMGPTVQRGHGMY